MPRYGKQTNQDWQRIRDEVQHHAANAFRKGERFTTGVIVGGGVRTKTFPEDALPGQPTQVAYVAHVRMLKFAGQPVVRDVLVVNQARQWVADENAPVLVELDKTGKLTVVGRAAIDNQQGRTTEYVPIYEVDGLDLSFIFGMETKLFSELSTAAQTALQAFRAANGLTPYAPDALFMIDPMVYVHGETYVQGYLDTDGSTRAAGRSTLTCYQSITLVPWNDASWVWGSAPVGWPAGSSSWGMTKTETICS